MKVLTLALGLSVASSFGFAQDIETLKGLKIQPVEKFQSKQTTLEVNGKLYRKPMQWNTKKQNLEMSRSAKPELPPVISGEVLYSENGFEEYLVTGEIIVKLSGNTDLDSFNQQNNLTIKQAYKNFYILKGSNNANLLVLVDKLQALPNVQSATIDLVDRNIDHF